MKTNTKASKVITEILPMEYYMKYQMFLETRRKALTIHS